MANVVAKNATLADIEFAADGVGSSGDPHIPHQRVTAVDLPTAVVHGQRTVTTAGTSVKLTASSTTVTTGVTVRALSTNTGIVYVADGTGDLSSSGYELAANESLFIAINDLNTVAIDAAENGEGVSYFGT